MKRLIQKVAVAGATISLATTLFAGAVFADGPTCEISGNGVSSTNTCVVKVWKKKITVQKNKAKIKNVVIAGADTGGNTADGNTTGSGDVSVDTGNATVTVTITNTVNQTNNP